MKRYTETEVRELTAKWYKKLADDGFVDIEATEEPVMHTDLSVENQYQIAHIHTVIGHFVANTKQKIPQLHRKVLNRYLKGMPYETIATEVEVTRQTVATLVKKYYQKAGLEDFE